MSDKQLTKGARRSKLDESKKYLLNDEQKELVEQNLRLVNYLANKLNIPYSEYDEMVSVGQIGLIKAAATYDASKGAKFSTYAVRIINNEFRMRFRKNKKWAQNTSLDEELASLGNGKLTRGDTIASPKSNFMSQIENRDVCENLISIILNVLQPRERLIKLYQMAGKSQKEVAKIYGISQSYVSRIYNRINKKIRFYFDTMKQYKEVFSMTIADDVYQINFSLKDVKNFHEAFANFLRNMSLNDLPDFTIVYHNGQIVITLPAEFESFSFVADFLEEIEHYCLQFIPNKEKSNKEKLLSKKTETDTSQIEDDTAIEVKYSLAQQVRDYIATKDSFTVKELQQHFMKMRREYIAVILCNEKKKGNITSVDRGVYKVNKN